MQNSSKTVTRGQDRTWGLKQLSGITFSRIFLKIIYDSLINLTYSDLGSVSQLVHLIITTVQQGPL